MNKIQFKNPFWDWHNICNKKFDQKDNNNYICAYCSFNKINTMGEDLGCILNERIKGDTVTKCGSFKKIKKRDLFY